MRSKTRLLALFLALMMARSPSGLASEPAPFDTAMRFMEQGARKLIEDGKAVGLAIAVVSTEGQAERTQDLFVGSTAVGSGQLPAGDTIFEIGPITQSMTGLILADQVLRQKTRLDGPIDPVYPAGMKAPRFGEEPITWRDLVTHTAGIPDFSAGFVPADALDPYAGYASDQMFRFLSETPLVSRPGAHWEYSDLAFALLGDLIGRQDASTYGELLSSLVLEPLGMSSTYLSLPPEARSRLAQGHNRERKATPHWNFDALASAGGIKSSLNDMKRYLHAQLSPPDSPVGRAVRESQRILADDLCNKDGVVPAYSYGWPVGVCGMSQPGIGKLHWNTGQTGGFIAFIGFSEEKKSGVIILSNLSDLYPEASGQPLEQRITMLGLNTLLAAAPGWH